MGLCCEISPSPSELVEEPVLDHEALHGTKPQPRALEHCDELIAVDKLDATCWNPLSRRSL